MKTGFFSKRYHPPGTAPGTLTAVAAEEAITPSIHVINYDAGYIEEFPGADIQTCRRAFADNRLSWLHVTGHPGPDTLQAIGELLGVHNLALEDIQNTGQRPKFEMYGESAFIVAALPVLDGDHVRFDQVSFYLGRDYVVSFNARDGRPFEPVMQRLRKDTDRVRRRGADYLLYCLLDMVIDQGFPVLERFGERLEELEASLLDRPDNAVMGQLHAVKRDLLMLRRILWPQREMLNVLLRDQPDIVTDETMVYLRDCYDHTIQIMDLLETYREIGADMIDIYLSSASQRLNKNMRVLTVIATLFIPPTFITGLYGMNFDTEAGPFNMPELGWPYGYLFAWSVMLLMAAGMLVYFKMKRWF